MSAVLLIDDPQVEGQLPEHTHVPIVKHVGLEVNRGEVVGVIGESGCGKSTLARVISDLLPAASGELRFNGATLESSVRRRSREELRRIQIVFQMPDVSFNPKKRVGQALGRPLKLYFGMDGPSCVERVRELLEMVELPRDYAERYPAELSGGEKQRVNLARAVPITLTGCPFFERCPVAIDRVCNRIDPPTRTLSGEVRIVERAFVEERCRCRCTRS